MKNILQKRKEVMKALRNANFNKNKIQESVSDK